MDYESLNDDFFRFVEDNIKSSATDIILRYGNKSMPFDIRKAAEQIDCRKRTARKLPSFLSHRNFVFPSRLSAEQASDEKVAAFHASLTGSGKHIVDMTAGLGIDAMTMALAGNHVMAFELDADKAAALAHNAMVMGLDAESHTDKKEFSGKSINVVNADSVGYATGISCQDNVDIVFIDPARRDGDNNRIFLFQDCLPDITSFYQNLLAKQITIYVKASPLLDVTSVLRQLRNIRKIYVVSVHGECKELLVELKAGSSFERLQVVDLDGDGNPQIHSLLPSDIGNAAAPIADSSLLEEDVCIYEPSAGFMKTGSASFLLSHYPDLKKASPGTWLFISRTLYPDFPGKIFRLTDIPDRRNLKRMKGQCYNVIARNYPITAAELARRLGVRPGIDDYLVGFRQGSAGTPVIVRAKRTK